MPCGMALYDMTWYDMVSCGTASTLKMVSWSGIAGRSSHLQFRRLSLARPPTKPNYSHTDRLKKVFCNSPGFTTTAIDRKRWMHVDACWLQRCKPGKQRWPRKRIPEEAPPRRRSGQAVSHRCGAQIAGWDAREKAPHAEEKKAGKLKLRKVERCE